MSLVWQNCSEEILRAKLAEWLKKTRLTDSILFLEGEMGAGKSTFVREILRVLSPKALSLGSPTFPLIQTYPTDAGVPLYHIDLYRLKSEAELHDSGIESQIEERNAIVCVEWASLFADSFAHWFTGDPKLQKKKVFVVSISSDSPSERTYRIEEFS